MKNESGFPNWFHLKCQECFECPARSGRHSVIVGRGDVPADILIVGDAPGTSDDLVGIPFVGSAGHLLDSMIKAIPDFPSVYLTTGILCHPRDERGEAREPEKLEFERCARWVQRIFRGVNPCAVVFLGKLSAKHCRTFLPVNVKIFSMMHPAYVVRNGGMSSPLFQHNVRVLEDVVSYVQQTKNTRSESDAR